jgi:hypothetical protein
VPVRVSGAPRAATSGRLAALVAGLDAARLATRPAPDRWSMKEVLAHLAAVERDLFVPRLRRMLAEDWPQFESFDPDAWARERDRRLGDARQDLAAFQAARAELGALLRGLGPGDLERVAGSRAFGMVTVHEYLTHVAEHDTEHLEELERLRASERRLRRRTDGGESGGPSEPPPKARRRR